MKIYQKPHLAAYSTSDVIEQTGPVQATYGIQIEIWRTGKVNQPQIIKTVEHSDTDIQSKIYSKIV